MTTDCQTIFRPLFDQQGFSPVKTFREGPRFFVVGGEYQGERAVFKADVEERKSRLPKARTRLQNEAIFLETAGLDHLPRFFAKGMHRGYIWMVMELVPGESQELGESAFLFKPSFFTAKNLDFILEFWEALHTLPRTNYTPGFLRFQREVARRYTLANYSSLTTLGKETLVGEELAARIEKFVRSSHRFFDARQTVITHHEFFAPHIFANHGELNVIDWENVGWGNSAYDFTELWMRSALEPEFQRELEQRFRRQQEEPAVFERLFRIEKVLQGLGNLRFFEDTQAIEERRVGDKMKAFLLEQIEKSLAA